MNETIDVNGCPLTIRTIDLGDVERLARMFRRLSPESVRNRFFSPLPRIPRPTLLRLSDVDHFRRDALVALAGDEIVAVARYDRMLAPRDRDAELAVTVEDAWHRRGLGRALTVRLAGLAAARGYDAFFARILPENRAALGLVRAVFPDADVRFRDGDYEARLPLRLPALRATG